MHSDHDQHNKSRSNREREGIPAVLIVSALVFIVLLLIGIGASYVLLSDPTQDKTIQESYKSLAKKRVSESPFPAELTASFARKTDRWAANGPVTNEDLSQLSRTKRIDALELNYSDVTAEGFTGVTADGAAKLSKIKDIHCLYVAGVGITDSAVREIAKCKTITRLDISNSKITDESLRELIKMPALAILQVSNCKQLSDMALNEFRKARPSCEVQTFVRMKAKDMD